MTNCTAGPRAVITELADFLDLADFAKLMQKDKLTEKGSSCPPANPHLYTEHDAYGMEYFHWPAWSSCLAVLLPSSCTPAH